MKKSLRTKMMRTILPLIIIPILLVGAFATYLTSREAVENNNEFLERRRSDIIVISENSFINNYFQHLNYGLQTEAEIDRKNFEKYVSNFTNRGKHLEIYAEFSAVNKNGDEIAKIVEGNSSKDYTNIKDESYFKKLANVKKGTYLEKEIDGEHRMFVTPIIMDNTFEGGIIAIVNYSFADFTITSIILGSATGVVIILTLIITLMIIIKNINKITKPIVKLKDTAEIVSTGNYNVTIGDINTKDEIEVLANTFNEMIIKVKKYSNHLEEMVAQRTKELNEANDELSDKNQQLLNDLKMAQKVQRGIIPDENSFPKRKDLRFGSKYIALETIGGDLYDVIELSDSLYALLIADVSGHGVPAALISAMAKVSFNTKSKGNNTSETCKQVNKEMYALIGDLNYDLTAFYAILDCEKKSIQFTNAAHHPACIYRAATKTVEKLDTPNTYIGLVEKLEFKSGVTHINDGDKIILFTDGLVEARNEQEEFYDYKRFTDYIIKNGHLPAKTFVNNLVEDLKRFCKERPIDDDIALLCIDFGVPSN